MARERFCYGESSVQRIQAAHLTLSRIPCLAYVPDLRLPT